MFDETTSYHLAKKQFEQTAMDVERVKKRELTVSEIANNARKNLQVISDQSPERSFRACAEGCALCCSVPTECSIPEAISIASAIRDKPIGEQEVIMGKLRANTTLIKTMSVEQHKKSIVQCALLDKENKCSVYDSRPLACVGFTSKSLSVCQKAYENPGDQSIEMLQDSTLYTAKSEISAGMMLAAKSKQLCASSYELQSVVLLAMEQPKLINQWLNGQKKFKAIKRWDSDSLFR